MLFLYQKKSQYNLILFTTQGGEIAVDLRWSAPKFPDCIESCDVSVSNLVCWCSQASPIPAACTDLREVRAGDVHAARPRRRGRRCLLIRILQRGHRCLQQTGNVPQNIHLYIGLITYGIISRLQLAKLKYERAKLYLHDLFITVNLGSKIP